MCYTTVPSVHAHEGYLWKSDEFVSDAEELHAALVQRRRVDCQTVGAVVQADVVRAQCGE